ncbi:MAG: EamA family transporter [Hyphomicrobiales bacterium]
MEPVVIFAVLGAAVMHASWNAVIKVGLDKFLSISLMSLFMGAISLVFIPFVDVPQGVTWIWIIISAALHTGYKLLLIRAYSVGDMGQVYPLARGTAPLITAIAAAVLLGEGLSPAMMAGIAVLCAGIWLMSFKGGGAAKELNPAAIWYALATSVFIGGYTLTDGIGVRSASTVASYAAWMFAIDGFWMVAVCMMVRGAGSLSVLARQWKTGLLVGALSVGGYWIVMWAMTRAPIAAVAALRETSVLAALVISVLFLKEKITPWRAGAALSIVAGVVILRVG